jgi:hypothetical protein
MFEVFLIYNFLGLLWGVLDVTISVYLTIRLREDFILIVWLEFLCLGILFIVYNTVYLLTFWNYKLYTLNEFKF